MVGWYESNDDIELKKDLGMLPFANIFMTDFIKKILYLLVVQL